MAAGGSAGAMEVLQVFMVCVYHNRVSRALQVDAPLAEPTDDSEQLFVIDRVVKLGLRELSGIESDGV